MLKHLLFLGLFCSTISGGDRFIHWQADQPLTWEDFQGLPDPNSGMLAQTNSRIGYSWNCVDGKFVAAVSARFDREKSWKKDWHSDKLLAHEQLHFDITELYARQLRKVFAGLEEEGCRMPVEEIREIANQVRAQWKASQDLYDLQSNHSEDRTGQAMWEAQVRKGLDELSAYALDENR